jgi:hypothetical protein
MTIFHDLWRERSRSHTGPFTPDMRSDMFPAVVDQSRRLRTWRPGEPFRQTGRRLPIGVATWSGYDMELLDLVDRASPVGPGSEPAVDVFDVDGCASQADFQNYIPGIGEVFQTPLVGYWVDGVLTDRATGAAGRALIVATCGLNPESVREHLDTVNLRR